jgi:hypothetical protein
MYMHTNCLLFTSCNKLHNSTFYHLKSLIALSIGMICIFFGGGATPSHTPPIPPSSFVPEYKQNLSEGSYQNVEVLLVFSGKAKKKICGFPVSRPYLAFGRQNPDPKLFYWITLVSVST